MPSNHTPNYQLNQWEASDRVLRTDFNLDNAKIDAAIKAVDVKADGKAGVSALSALSQRVDALSTSKADVAALSDLRTLVNGKGNCQITFGSYTGTGTFGKNAPNQLTFPFKPLLVVIGSDVGSTSLIPGMNETYYATGMMISTWKMSWSGNSLSWYAAQSLLTTGHNYDLCAMSQANEEGKIYPYIAFGRSN